MPKASGIQKHARRHPQPQHRGTHAAGSIIHQKNMEWGISASLQKGRNRVINEFENGNVYMIEGNKAIDFIGEVTILAGMTPDLRHHRGGDGKRGGLHQPQGCGRWLAEDMNILSLTARHTAFKLSTAPPTTTGQALLSAQLPALRLHREICRAAGDRRARPAKKQFTVSRTRQLLQEEIGVNVKTLNRTIRQLRRKVF